MAQRSEKTTYKGKVSVDVLKPYEKNPRVMPEREMKALKRSLDEFGFVEPVVVDEHMLIIGGHQRVEAAKALGIKKVPVMIVAGLDDAEKAALNVALNRIHGDWDLDKLTDVLHDISLKDDLDLDLTGFTGLEIDSIMNIDTDFSFTDEDPTDLADVDGVKEGRGYTVHVAFSTKDAADAFLAWLGLESVEMKGMTTFVKGDDLEVG